MLSLFLAGVTEGHVDSDGGVLLDTEFLDDFLFLFEEFFQDVVFGEEDNDSL